MGLVNGLNALVFFIKLGCGAALQQQDPFADGGRYGWVQQGMHPQDQSERSDAIG